MGQRGARFFVECKKNKRVIDTTTADHKILLSSVTVTVEHLPLVLSDFVYYSSALAKRMIFFTSMISVGEGTFLFFGNSVWLLLPIV